MQRWLLKQRRGAADLQGSPAIGSSRPVSTPSPLPQCSSLTHKDTFEHLALYLICGLSSGSTSPWQVPRGSRFAGQDYSPSKLR